MTSRERILLAIGHKKTDRTPADYRAHQQVTDSLIEKLGVADSEKLLQALYVDMRRISFDYGQPDTGPDADGYMCNMWGLKWRDKMDNLIGFLPLTRRQQLTTYIVINGQTLMSWTTPEFVRNVSDTTGNTQHSGPLGVRFFTKWAG